MHDDETICPVDDHFGLFRWLGDNEDYGKSYAAYDHLFHILVVTVALHLSWFSVYLGRTFFGIKGIPVKDDIVAENWAKN